MTVNMQRSVPVSLYTDSDVKIRNSKYQILNKSKYQNPNVSNLVFNFGNLNFEIV